MHHGKSLARPSFGTEALVAHGLDTAAGSSSVSAPSGEPLVKGRLREVSLRPGLSLYASDVCDQRDLDVSSSLPPGLLLVMALSGEADVSYGERRFQLGPRLGDDRRPQHEGLAIALNQTDSFTRRLRAGARRRVVTLALAPQWLDESRDGLGDYPRIRALRHEHLAVQRWRLSSRLLALASDVVEMHAPSSPLQGLFLESRCLEMAAEALSAIAGEPPESQAGAQPGSQTGLRPRERKRLSALREYLDSGEGDNDSLHALANRIGMSTSTLQRGFRALTGNSVCEYQRQRRLRLARGSLEREGISVSEAAHIAGYTSAANFATAFRRQFGVTPGQLRARS
jgi:AraC-like DNA-binding protein